MKKRGQNEGNIRQRPDGKWEARYIIGRYPNGKQIRKSVYGKTRQEVAGKLADALSDIKNGTYIEQTGITFIEWLYKWLETYAKLNIRITTYTNYEIYIRGHLKPYFCNTKLNAVTPEMLQEFLNAKLVSGRLDNKESGLSSLLSREEQDKLLEYLNTID